MNTRIRKTSTGLLGLVYALMQSEDATEREMVEIVDSRDAPRDYSGIISDD